MTVTGVRIAVLGAATPLGEELRAALAEARVPGTLVDLYGTESDEAILADYAGEARLVQEPDLDVLANHDVVYLCETGAVASNAARAVEGSALVVDMAGALADGPGVPVVHPDVNPAAADGGRCRAPHVLTALLVELLHPLEAAFGIEEVTATVLRPAADYGQPGVEELRQQTVRLLNFLEVPTEVFGRQLAFNLIPQSRLHDGAATLDRAAGEVATLLGWPRRRLALALLAAPLFHGHGLQLRVRTTRPSTAATIRETLAALSAGSASTPLDVTGEARTVVGDVADDGMGGTWIWAVAGEAAARSARLAVRLAGLAPRGRRSSAS